MATKLDVPLAQIQGNVTPGFRKDFQAFLFLRFPEEAIPKVENEAGDPRRAREWLGELQPCIASAETVATFNSLYRLVRNRIRNTPLDEKEPEHRDDPALGVKRFLRSTWINVAFTARGLGALLACPLGQEPWAEGREHAKRLEAFAVGMCNRNLRTGDHADDIAAFTVRDSVRKYWDELTNRGDKPEDEEREVAHAVVIIGATSQEELNAELSRQIELAEKHALTVIDGATMRGATLGGGKEHFGFVDVISQPDDDDPLAGWERDGAKTVAPGEFILGCGTEGKTLDAIGAPLDVPAWEKHGSYLVLRKLRQDVDQFWQQMQALADRVHAEIQGLPVPAGAAAPVDPEHPSDDAMFMAAKMIGRWPSGAPMRSTGAGGRPFPIDPANHQAPADPVGPLQVNDYLDDKAGARCPLFAHIRKANPRVTSSAVSEEDLRIHRIIRRGVPYNDNETKGLVFLAYQADIQRGYEHVQGSWLNAPYFGRPDVQGGRLTPSPGADPLAAVRSRRDDLSVYLSGREGEADRGYTSQPLARTIVAEGGGYFFAPSLDALALLARGGMA
jgi:Dyp-type peroxidase family